MQNPREIDDIADWMCDNRFDCVKYNYSLEAEVQNFSSFNASIQLSADKRKFLITNQKPMADEIHALEADPEEHKKL